MLWKERLLTDYALTFSKLRPIERLVVNLKNKKYLFTSEVFVINALLDGLSELSRQTKYLVSGVSV